MNFPPPPSGHHECEVFAGQPGATESARTWSDCVKNPGHARFIPYPDLCLEHLPEGAQTQDVLSRVRSYAARTVRLRVGYTSTHRPDGFPFSNVRGTHLVHTGSGWIDNIPTSNIPPIRRFRVSPRVCMVRRAPGQPCPCPECSARPGNSSPRSLRATNSSPRSLRASNSSPMRKEWYEFRVITACHVVYDKEEAKRTQVDVFYNDESSRVDGTMKTIWGFDVIHVDPENDTCILRCASHDYKIVKEFTPLRMSIFHGASLQRLLSGPSEQRPVCSRVPSTRQAQAGHSWRAASWTDPTW